MAEIESPFMTMAEAAAYLRYEGKYAADAARQVLIRAGMPLYRRNGRTWLVRKSDLDHWIETGECTSAMQRRITEIRRAKPTRIR